MTKILLIGNIGKLLDYASFHLSSRYSIELFQVDKRICRVSLANSLLLSLRKTGYDCVVFLSGETRVVSNMSFYNVSLPTFVFDHCSAQSIPFIYLSSLSVYNFTDQLTLPFTRTSSPPDHYGRTKYNFDNYILSKSVSSPVVCLVPGSFHHSKSHYSMYARIKRLYITNPFAFLLLRSISFPFVLYLTDYSLLVKTLETSIDSILSNDITGCIFRHVFTRCPLSTIIDFADQPFKLYLKFDFVRLFSKLIPYRIYKKLCLLLLDPPALFFPDIASSNS